MNNCLCLVLYSSNHPLHFLSHLNQINKHPCQAMAALSMTSQCFHHRTKSYQIQEQIKIRRACTRSVICMSWQGHEPEEVDTSSSSTKGEKKQEAARNWSQLISGGVGKFGKDLKDNLSPKQKGDWKDLTLMSLSFAIYVYISQRIVCAYYVWVYMPKQLW